MSQFFTYIHFPLILFYLSSLLFFFNFPSFESLLSDMFYLSVFHLRVSFIFQHVTLLPRPLVSSLCSTFPVFASFFYSFFHFFFFHRSLPPRRCTSIIVSFLVSICRYSFTPLALSLLSFLSRILFYFVDLLCYFNVFLTLPHFCFSLVFLFLFKFSFTLPLFCFSFCFIFLFIYFSWLFYQ